MKGKGPQFLAAGDESGTLHILDLPDCFSRPISNEVSRLYIYIYICSQMVFLPIYCLVYIKDFIYICTHLYVIANYFSFGEEKTA